MGNKGSSRDSGSISRPSVDDSEVGYFQPPKSALLSSRRIRKIPDRIEVPSSFAAAPFSLMIVGSNSRYHRTVGIELTSFGYDLPVDSIFVRRMREYDAKLRLVAPRTPPPGKSHAQILDDRIPTMLTDRNDLVEDIPVVEFSGDKFFQDDDRFSTTASVLEEATLGFRRIEIPDVMPRESGRAKALEQDQGTSSRPEKHLQLDLDEIIPLSPTSIVTLSRSFDEIRRLTVFDLYPPKGSHHFRFEIMNGVTPRRGSGSDEDAAFRRLRVPAIACRNWDGRAVFSVARRHYADSDRRDVVVTDLDSKRVSEAHFMDSRPCAYRLIKPVSSSTLFLGGGNSRLAHFICCDMANEKIVFSSGRQDVQLSGVCRVDENLFVTGLLASSGFGASVEDDDEVSKDLRLYDLRLGESVNSLSFGDVAGVTALVSCDEASRIGLASENGCFWCARHDASIWEIDVRKIGHPVLRLGGPGDSRFRENWKHLFVIGNRHLAAISKSQVAFLLNTGRSRFSSCGVKRLDDSCSSFCFVGRGLERNEDASKVDRRWDFLDSEQGVGFALRLKCVFGDGTLMRVFEWLVE